MIHVFGTVCLDRMRRVAAMPAAGGYASVDFEEVKVGGEAANTAYALVGWQEPIRLYGNAVEPEVLDQVAALGMPTEDFATCFGKAPVCDIYVTPDGQRTMFGVGFGDMAATIDLASVSFPEAGWFTIDMNFGDVGREVASRAKEEGQRLYVMDMADPDRLGTEDVWQSSTDWFGAPGDTTANLEWVKSKAIALGATAVLTDSGREIVVGLPDGTARAYPTFPPPPPGCGSEELDSTGAGDRFRAGMLLGLHSGWPFQRCLAFGAAAASMKLAQPGAIAPVPSVGEVEAYQRLHPTVLQSFSA